MKKTLLISIATVSLAAFAGAATAQQPAQQSAPLGLRADTDSNGRVSRAEFVDRRIERLTAADANRDGAVSAEERQAHRASGQRERAEGRFARLDADHDGALSRDEFAAARAARPMRAHGEGRPGPRRADHQGRQAGQTPVIIADMQAKTEQAFARLDADNDGFLTGEERRAGMQQPRESRRQRMAERRAAREASRPVPASE